MDETAFSGLARALVEAGHDLPRILDALSASLTATLCDGCSIELAESGCSRAVTPRYAIFALPSVKLLHGCVAVIRNETSPAFEPRDFTEIETCIAYASLAAELALVVDAERAAARTEHVRTEQFYRTLTGIVAHDLRAPVAAILIGTEMLVAKHQDDAPLVDVVARIVSFANRMTGMVDQLLDLTRVQLGGGIPIARTSMRLAPVIESVIRELAARYPRNQFSIAGDADVKGVWDPDRLRQVAASVVTNAVQHGLEDGAVDIVMSQDERLATVAVHNDVRDEPISPEAQRELFDPARRSDEDRARTGLGLGLYLAREILAAHGGRITVESTSAGTTFSVMLPT